MAQAGAMGNVGVAVAASLLLYHLKVKQTFYAIAAKQVAMLKYINTLLPCFPTFKSIC